MKYWLIDSKGNYTPIGHEEGTDAYYILIKIDVPRGIKKKGSSKEKEVLILGMNFQNLQKYCSRNKLNLIVIKD